MFHWNTSASILNYSIALAHAHSLLVLTTQSGIDMTALRARWSRKVIFRNVATTFSEFNSALFVIYSIYHL